MPEAQDELLARIAAELKRPVALDPSLDARIMADVRAHPRRRQPLPRAVEHRRAIRRPSLRLAHMHHDDGAAEPLAQHDRLLERRVGAGAAVQTHEQAREHG